MKVTNRSPAVEKIRIFRALFRGREDVYPRRFESVKTGRSGYQPACANEWNRLFCDKPKVKCGACPNRRFMSVTDEEVRWHLTGRDKFGKPFVMGVYPLLANEHCWFLAADFDKESWREDIAAVAAICRERDIPVAVERSRSGNGAHLWFFFNQPVAARLAREFGSVLLTATMEHYPDVGLDSYDRLFPNQDTMPKGGVGNLIALPLQKMARDNGNSVFLDEQFQPYEDQWAFLSGVRRLTIGDVNRIVEPARRENLILAVDEVLSEESDTPWLLPPSRARVLRPIIGPLPEEIEVVLSDQLYILKEGLNPMLRGRLIRLAAFANPEFHKAQAMRMNTYGKSRVICCAEDYPQHVALPRGCLDRIRMCLKECGVRMRLRDERNPGTPLAATFCGELRPEQALAGKAMLAHDTGVLAAGTAFGKTVLAAWLIAQRGVNTLVLVNRRQLQAQWVAQLATFLDIPQNEIGRIGGGKRQITGTLEVALLQSLGRKGDVDDIVANYGHLIVDECHTISAPAFERVARRCKARYVAGLSATPVRKDGHHPIIFMQCGPLRHRVNPAKMRQIQSFRHTVWVRPTTYSGDSFLGAESQPPPFHALCDDLSHNEARNRLIVADVLAAVKEGRSPVVLTERRNHLAELAARLDGAVRHLVIMRGGMGRKQLAAIDAQLAAIPDTEPRVLLATGSYLGEGFDDARLDTLFLTMPISWRGRIAQYAGRLHRAHAGKREVRICDYADLNVPMLARMFDRRCKGYRALGYSILLPLKTVPGWPEEVPMPVSSGWQETYADSVRRLVRDGVESELAGLFVEATQRKVPEGMTTGVARARSAVEAFLYRRLETLPATSGHFQLNAQLGIPFDGTGGMEVDLLCPERRLVIEIDGPHHFAGAEAYRRDRRKDALLQENGYHVLRFLSDDIADRLGEVLDAILRAWTSLGSALKI
ncbi:MAG: DUF559 domain-containing protein [Kiritimatiellae bacterium]|nr:DUF559 domain-containing protein [Kiritimatiellia bacterium]